MKAKLSPLTAFVAGLLLCFAGSATADLIPSPANDVALASNGGSASSTLGNWDAGHTPAELIDGDRDGAFDDGGYHTAGGDVGPGTLTIQLASAGSIGRVNIFNRTDCCGNRIDGGGTTPFKLELFNGATSVFSGLYTFSQDIFVDLGAGAPHFASGKSIGLSGILADRVEVTQNFADAINLAEIEVYIPEPASLGLAVIAGLTLVPLVRRRKK